MVYEILFAVSPGPQQNPACTRRDVKVDFDG